MTITEILMLDLFKDGKKVANEDITNHSMDELEKLLLIQDEFYGRDWKYRKIFKREERER